MGLSSVERRTSPENPSTSLSNPAPWLTEALGGAPTTSGVAVNERTALTYAAAFACINVLSKDIAQLPVFVYKRNGDARDPAREHDVWRVMHDRPNPMMTPFTFKQTLQAHAISWGNGYAEIERDASGRLLHLWPLLPDRTKVVIRDGKKWIVTRIPENAAPGTPADTNKANGAGKWVGLPSDRVIHIPGLGFDGITGYSVIHMARNAIGAGMAAEEFTARLFSNGASPRIALSHPGKLTPDARTNLKLSWDAAYSGLSNAHRTAILEEGLKVEKIGLPAKDQELIESSRFSIEQMARFFDIPMMRLHSTTAITSWGTGLEQWQRAYLIHTLGPWLVQWEETVNWSLFDEQERLVYFAEFLREALLQGDMAAQGQYFTQLFGVGALSPNQIARKLNMPTVGPEGDQRFIPLNFISLESAGRPLPAPRNPAPPPPDAPPQDDPPSADERATAEALTLRQTRSAQHRQRMQSAYERVYLQVAERMVTKHVERARRAVKKLEETGDMATFQKWVREFFESERASIQEAFLPASLSLGDLVASAVLTEIGSQANVSRDVEVFVSKYVEALGHRESGSSIGQLLQISNEGDTADGTAVARLSTRLDGWAETRASQIAAREPVQAGNATARHVYEQLGVRRLMWIASGENCPFCTSLNGKVVGVERAFLEAGESVGSGKDFMKPSTKIGAPPLHKGCDCQIVAA